MDAGADMIFPEGLHSVEEFAKVADELKKHNSNVYLLANMTEFGKTPIISMKDFSNAGYDCVIYPVSTLRVAMSAVNLFLRDLKNMGHQLNSSNKMQTRKELYDMLDYTPGEEWIYPNPNGKVENAPEYEGKEYGYGDTGYHY